jgi:predicted protein tyrosine phosphatase
MEIFVYSRYGLEAARPHEVPHIILSITSGPDDQARLRQNRECRGVLRLSFPDAEAASEQYAENELFSAEHAKQVWDFALRHRQLVERILVHCDAGKSRSPALAAALARVLNGSDTEYFGGRYTPNMRVYRMLLDAHLTKLG